MSILVYMPIHMGTISVLLVFAS